MLKEKKASLIQKMIGDEVLKTPEIIKAFEDVARENFVPGKYKSHSYADEPLPIGNNQTISQPTTIAIMLEALEPKKGDKILEVGSGCGYVCALLSKIVGLEGKVIGIEIVPDLVKKAKGNLKNFHNVEIICGDGSKGHVDKVHYDGIIVSAAAPKVPEKLFEQLKEGAILVIPVGSSMWGQKMMIIKKVKGKMKSKNIGPFVFVPLIGEF